MKNGTRIVLGIVALLPLIAAACGAAPGAADLSGRTWVLQAYGPAGQEKPALAAPPVTLTLDGAAGTLGGSAGCNGYGGSYRLSGTTLRVSEVISTLMACAEPGVMEQESAYLGLLGTAQGYQVSGTELQIRCADGQVLVFEQQQ